MRRIRTVFAALSLFTVALAAGTAGATEPASPPAAAQPDSPAPDAAKITKSRSNIQNNREAAPPAEQSDPTATEPEQVVKTKTKSNQSND